MAYGLLNLTFNHEGEEWGNTWGFTVGEGLALGPDDLDNLGCRTALSDDGMVSQDPFRISLVKSVMRFHQLLLPPFVQMTEAYVTDGIKQSRNDLMGRPNIFWAQSLTDTGRNGLSQGPEIYAPGTVTLQVNKNPISYGVRKGRSFLRALLLDSDVKLGGRGGIAWTSATARQLVIDKVTNAIDASEMRNFFATAEGGSEPMLGIPSYIQRPPGNLFPEALTGMRAIDGLAIIGPVNRQMKSGRRRAT